MALKTLKHTRLLGLAAVVSVAAMTLAACGSSSDESSGSAPSAGSGGGASTSVPTGLDPHPLAEKTDVTIGVGPVPTAQLSVAALADELGEFAKENLNVKITTADGPTEITLLQSGRMDLAGMGVTAAFFNAVHAGAKVEVVMAAGRSDSSDPGGLYVSDKLLGSDGKFDPCKLKQGKLTVSLGPSGQGNVGALLLSKLAAQCDGATLKDVYAHMTFSPLSGQNLVTALDNGAVDLALLYSPLPTLPGVKDHATMVLQSSTVLDTTPAGWVMGSLATDKPLVAQAIVRAMMRTERDYLQSDYTTDPKVVAALSKVLSQPDSLIKAAPVSVFDDKLPTDLMEPLQEVYMAGKGVLTYTDPIPARDLVDSSLLDRAEQGSPVHS